MASWQRAGNLLVEKVEIRQVNVPVEESTIVALSRFGGPIATFTSTDRSVRVYAGGGKWIASHQFPSTPCLGGFGWTDDLVLVLVTDDQEGSVYVWDDFLGCKPRKLKEKFGVQVRMAVLWESSVVALTQKMSVLVMKDLRTSPHIRWPPVTFPIVNLPRALCVLRPEATSDSSLEIAIALADQAGILVASPERKSVDARVPQFRALPSRLLAPHPTEPIIASLDVDDRLLVMSNTLEEILYARDCQLGSGFQSVPLSLSWCLGGPGHCVVALWQETPWSQQMPVALERTSSVYGGEEEEVQEEEMKYGPGALVLGFLPSKSKATIDGGPTSDDAQAYSSSAMVARFSFEGTGTVFSSYEVDGVRVFCPATRQMHLIRRVSRSTQAIDAIGSLSPAAVLLETIDDELSLAAMADDDLIMAADDLMDCAKFEQHFERLLELLRAAQVAKDRIMDDDKYSEKARLARKLAQLCEVYRGLHFLTEAQLTSTTFIEAQMLGLFSFACRVAYLGYPREAKAFASVCKLPLHPFELLEARLAASAALSTSAATSAQQAYNPPLKANVALTAMAKALFRSDGFTRTDCAAGLGLFVALEQGTTGGDPAASKDLLLRLCDMESRFSKRLICLLQLQETDRVLTLLDTSRGVDFDLKARASLFCLSKAVTPQQQEKVATHPVAEQAIRASLRSTGNAERLEKWLIIVTALKDRRARALHDRAILLAETAMFASELTMELKKKSVLLQESAREFDNSGKPFFATQARDYLDLVLAQEELAIPRGKSLVQTVQECVARGRDDLAERFRKQFKLEPNLFWRAKIRGMGKRGLWVEAARLVTLQKEAGRWVKLEDVLEMCFDAGADSAASRIAFDVMDDANPDRARAFARLRLWKEALTSATKSKCIDALEEVAYRCRDAETAKKASDLLEEIRRNPALATNSQGSDAGGLFGFVSGAVKVEPQRCQQQ